MIETVQETNIRHSREACPHAGEEQKPSPAVIPAKETAQETLDRHAMWKTQPPKSPLSGGLVTQFPPDKGGKGG